jgi:hypothetical protein
VFHARKSGRYSGDTRPVRRRLRSDGRVQLVTRVRLGHRRLLRRLVRRPRARPHIRPFHPGFCNGKSADDPAYPFANGQLANADGNFTGLDVGDDDLKIVPAALPGTTWHDVMTYCDFQWPSSYSYLGIRARLVAEEMLFPDRDDNDHDDDGAGAAGGAARREVEVTRNPVHIAAVVNLTARTAGFAHVTPLPGQSPPSAVPYDSRFALRVRMADGTSVIEPVVFKPPSVGRRVTTRPGWSTPC